MFSSHNKPAPAGLINPENNQQTGRLTCFEMEEYVLCVQNHVHSTGAWSVPVQCLSAYKACLVGWYQTSESQLVAVWLHVNSLRNQAQLSHFRGSSLPHMQLLYDLLVYGCLMIQLFSTHTLTRSAAATSRYSVYVPMHGVFISSAFIACSFGCGLS